MPVGQDVEVWSRYGLFLIKAHSSRVGVSKDLEIWYLNKQKPIDKKSHEKHSSISLSISGESDSESGTIGKNTNINSIETGIKHLTNCL